MLFLLPITPCQVRTQTCGQEQVLTPWASQLARGLVKDCRSCICFFGAQSVRVSAFPRVCILFLPLDLDDLLGQLFSANTSQHFPSPFIDCLFSGELNLMQLGIDLMG